jgi:hypothetical protein
MEIAHVLVLDLWLGRRPSGEGTEAVRGKR